ncbi:MAG: helix-turn-helix domain-containing protein [Desulfobaccales bacterium]
MVQNVTPSRTGLGEIFKDRRRKAGLSQKKAASLAGCKEVTITDIETGRRAPRMETIWRLGALFCLSRSEVLWGLHLAAHHRRNRQAYEMAYIERTVRRFSKETP